MFSTLNISVRLYLIFYNCYWSADPHTEQHWDAIGPNFLFLARDYFSRLSLNFSIIGRLQDTTGDYRRLATMINDLARWNSRKALCPICWLILVIFKAEGFGKLAGAVLGISL